MSPARTTLSPAVVVPILVLLLSRVGPLAAPAAGAAGSGDLEHRGPAAVALEVDDDEIAPVRAVRASSVPSEGEEEKAATASLRLDVQDEGGRPLPYRASVSGAKTGLALESFADLQIAAAASLPALPAGEWDVRIRPGTPVWPGALPTWYVLERFTVTLEPGATAARRVDAIHGGRIDLTLTHADRAVENVQPTDVTLATPDGSVLRLVFVDRERAEQVEAPVRWQLGRASLVSPAAPADERDSAPAPAWRVGRRYRTFEVAPPGTYLLRCATREAAPVEREVVLRGGEATPVELTLRPAP